MPFFRVTKNLKGLLAVVATQLKNHAINGFQLMVGDLSRSNRAIAFGALKEEHMDEAHSSLSGWDAGFYHNCVLSVGTGDTFPAIYHGSPAPRPGRWAMLSASSPG